MNPGARCLLATGAFSLVPFLCLLAASSACAAAQDASSGAASAQSASTSGPAAAASEKSKKVWTNDDIASANPSGGAVKPAIPTTAKTNEADRRLAQALRAKL